MTRGSSRVHSASLVTMAACALLLTALPASAAPVPDHLGYRGQALDASGRPLEGTVAVVARYFDPRGAALFAESLPATAVRHGSFSVDLGRGEAAAGSRFDSLHAVFTACPEVELELVLDGVAYGPRVGILPAGHTLESVLVAAGVRTPGEPGPHFEGYRIPGGESAIQAAILRPMADGGARRGNRHDHGARRRPFEVPMIGPRLSQPVRDLPRTVVQPLKDRGEEVNELRHETLYDEDGHLFGTTSPKAEDVLAGPGGQANGRTPSLSLDFEGINNVNGVLPPDTEGTVGPNHYIQVVNLSFAIYDKSGTLLAGPTNTNSLWSGFGGPCQSFNDGDAIALYDQQANRFVLSQFAVSSSNQSVCFAVSQTPDPTGSWYLYEVVTPRFPDYFKLGVWPAANNNAYFMGTNSGAQNQYDVFAIDRARMIAGQTARPMQFFQSFPNLMMPADSDGATPPPAGRPGTFYSFRDGGEPYFGSPSTDSLDVYEFDVDWSTPSNSSISLVRSITPSQGLANFNWTVCGFFVSNCIPQPGTSQGIDSASWWPMQRLVYRNFGSHETLVGAWTVDVNSTGNRAAPRWFELRDTGGGWTLYQQGTHSPDAVHRWMPSIAMDGAGNIAIGYSRGNASNFPSIYYATRNAGDPLGTLEAEAVLLAGGGSQTHSAARWGDYASMELDPADDCTFWFTTEYLASTSSASWRTHVGAFSIPGCGGPVNQAPVVTITTPADGSSFSEGDPVSFAGTATDAEDGPLSSSLSWTSSRDGSIGTGASFSTSSLSVGTHTITASVTDSGGAFGSDSITVTITSAGGERLHEDFEGGLGAWTTSGLWHLVSSSGCASPGYSSPVSSVYYGQSSTCTYDAGDNTGDLISPVVTGITASSELSFDYYRVVESYTGGSYDQTQVAVSVAGSGSWTTVWSRDSTNASTAAWTASGAISLASFAGNDVQIRFRFDTIDGSFNNFTGWFVDDVVVTGGGASNTPPSVTITAPANGATFVVGTSVSFSGTATDAEDGPLSSSLSWTSSLDGAIGSGASFSTSSLSVGSHTITASVTDSGGLSDSDVIGITITPPPNTPPSVTITAPANGATFVAGSSVSFSGTATDAEDGPLSSSLSWTSSLDGAIGSGASFSTSSLSVGSHTITASVTDSGGLSDSDAIGITITPAGGGNPFEEDFEGGLAGWTTSGLWHLVSNSGCASPGYSSPVSSVYYGQNSTCNYNAGDTSGDLISPVISGVTTSSELSFDYYRVVESYTGGSYDQTQVAVSVAGSGSWTTVWSRDSTSASTAAWTASGPISLAGFAGNDIRIRFRFDSIDGSFNNFTGWFVDDVVVTGGAASSCRVDSHFSGGSEGWTNSGASTCTTGTFVVGTPTQVTNGGVVTQVGGDHTSGTGNAFFTAVNTAAGTDDVDGGNCIALSPVYSIVEASDVSVWYFHGQRDAGGDPSGDFFRLEVSTNGGSTWTPMVSTGDITSNAAWTEATTTIPAGSNVRFRVQASDGTASGDLVEAGVDDIAICAN